MHKNLSVWVFVFWYPLSNPNGSKTWLCAKKIEFDFDSKWAWNPRGFQMISGLFILVLGLLRSAFGFPALFIGLVEAEIVMDQIS